LVERLLREQEVVGSNPATPTKNSLAQMAELVDALGSGPSEDLLRGGSSPLLGTRFLVLIDINSLANYP
jgi:hypothetical protein